MKKKETHLEKTDRSKINRSLVELAKEKTEEFDEASIIEKLKSYRTTDDVIAYMFGFLDVDKIPSDCKIIHEAMKQLKDEFQEMMDEFIFTTDDIFPYSPSLERVLGRLQISGVIELINPRGAFYFILPEIKKDLNARVSSRFLEVEQDTLKRMAHRFQEVAMPTLV